MENFRRNLATAIEARELKKVAVAEAARTSRAHVNSVLKGLTEPTLPMCERLAMAAGFTLLSMLESPDNFSDALLTGAQK